MNTKAYYTLTSRLVFFRNLIFKGRLQTNSKSLLEARDKAKHYLDLAQDSQVRQHWQELYDSFKLLTQLNN
jgi:hypothetical protein